MYICERRGERRGRKRRKREPRHRS